MTDLNKPVARRTMRQAEHGRRLVVMLEPGDVLAIRPERTRKWFRLPLKDVYVLAVKAEVAAARPRRRPGQVTRGLLSTDR